LSFLGICLTALAVGLHYWYLVLGNIVCVALLWFYSTSFKRQLLIGNIVISLLTAWTTLVLFFAFSDPSNAFNTTNEQSVKFFRLAFLYGGFAFIISLVREAIKDIEDMEGDARYGCKTLPIIVGVRTTKIYAGIWMAVLIAALIVLQFYVLQFGWWPSVVYATALVIGPLCYSLVKLRKAVRVKEFAALSSLTKWIMLTGILSMIFFAFYF
jgi:4-hydroxybenzoate polyprenyltransferase